MTWAALILFLLKILVDANFGHRALKEVHELKEAVVRKFDDHEIRLSKLETRD